MVVNFANDSRFVLKYFSGKPPFFTMVFTIKGLHEYYTMETQKIEFFSKKFEIRILTFDEELKSL